MDFEKAHQLLLDHHLSIRTGERRGRLSRGHQYAEKLLLRNVWWPLFGNLDDLHPEYEVYDWNRKSQFQDFAYWGVRENCCRKCRNLNVKLLKCGVFLLFVQHFLIMAP